MNWIALKMLTGDRAKYLGLVFGVTFATLLMAQQLSIFVSIMKRTGSQILDVRDADICSGTVWPTGDQPILGAGLLFWGEDNRTYFQFGVLNNGKFWIARKQDGKWLGTVAANVDSPAIKNGVPF